MPVQVLLVNCYMKDKESRIRPYHDVLARAAADKARKTIADFKAFLKANKDEIEAEFLAGEAPRSRRIFSNGAIGHSPLVGRKDIPGRGWSASGMMIIIICVRLMNSN